MKQFVAAALVVFAVTPAMARSDTHISFGFYAPAPVVYAPAPVYYQPPVVYYPPVQQVYYAPQPHYYGWRYSRGRAYGHHYRPRDYADNDRHRGDDRGGHHSH